MSDPLYQHVRKADDNNDDDDLPSTTPYSPHRTFDPDDDDTTTTDLASIESSKDYQARRRHATILFSISTVLLFADQNLMSPNLTAMAREFNFNDQQRDTKLGGDIALAFFVLGAPASFVIGCLGDSWNRTRLFAITVGIGEGACLATYFVQSYRQLYVCRAVTGFSMGGALPLIYSILGDLFVAEQRHGVSAMVGIGTGAGIALGQGIAGFLGPTLGWRLPFLVISIPALGCAAMVWLTVQDPERGAMEQAVRDHHRRGVDNRNVDTETLEMIPLDENGQEDSNQRANVEPDTILPLEDSSEFDVRLHWVAFRNLMATPTVLLSLLQGAPGCLPWGIVNTYLNDFLSENRGMTVEYATFVVLLFGFGNFLGMLLGGGGGSYLYRVDKRYPPLLAGSMAILGCLPFWILLNWVHADTFFPLLASVSIVAGLGSGVTGPIVKATLQNVTVPTARGQAFALFNTFDDFGRGLGPVFIALLITRLGGRTQAFNVGVFGWILCGTFNLAMYLTVTRDEERVQSSLAARLAEQRAAAVIVVEDGDDDGVVVLRLPSRDDDENRSLKRRASSIEAELT